MSRIGDRVSLGGRDRTVGLLASRGAHKFAITSHEASAFETYKAAGMELRSHNLIRAIPIEDDFGDTVHHGYSVGSLAAVEKLLDVTVRRFHPQFGRIQGLVTSLRGAVRMRVGEKRLIVNDLVEVTFDVRDSETGRTQPPLESADSGALITTWEGHTVGILVGGSECTGYAVPLGPFLAVNGLDLCQVNPTAGVRSRRLDHHTVQVESGIASLGAELAREKSLGLDDIPEAA